VNSGSKYPTLQADLFPHLKVLNLASFLLVIAVLASLGPFLHLKNFSWAHMWLLLTRRGFFLRAETKKFGQKRLIWLSVFGFTGLAAWPEQFLCLPEGNEIGKEREN
jgi:hypothetical protein